MAEPTVNINLDNPTEVARETLRRLAMRRIAPTPDNYQTLYEEIVGKPAPAGAVATAASVLAELATDLQTHYPALSTQAASLHKAIGKSDWRQCSWLLSEIAVQLKHPPGDGKDRTQADKGKAARPHDLGTAELEDNLALLRDLLAKTLEFGMMPQLSHAPRLAEKARQLAVAVRDASNDLTLRGAAAGLKSLWVSIELQASDAQQQQEMLKRILLLLVENIG
ncbi:MAG: GGDEF domain-containing protein, partial [Betaproteobacteria bacterium]|nr:GGDEF domain-containing protein [Betaproteobacteria bacterium]